MTHYLQDDIHLVLVCTRSRFNEMTITTIKSIMFHRRKSYNITFHIFTDSDGEKIISNYANSIANFCTKFLIYQIEKLLEIGQKFKKKIKLSLHIVQASVRSQKHLFMKFCLQM
jgi:hypothetical protein